MPPLSSPRRFRRPLLLPPGWVALGWLLLLGCLVLQSHWRQLRQANLLQLTMPPLKPKASLVAFYRMHGKGQATADYNSYVDVGDKNALVRIDRMRPWHTINFIGQPFADFRGAQEMESAIRAINADSSRAGGVRIHFQANASYASLVKVLDIMNSANQKKYWLDIRHRPATLYAITDKLLPGKLKQVQMITCGFQPQAAAKLAPLSSFWQRFLTEYWPPAWRLPWLLLVALGALSVYKLGGAAKRRGKAT